MLLKASTGMMKKTSRRRLLLIASIACALAVGVHTADSVLNVGTASLTITLVDPPLTLSGGSVDGSPCTLTGSTLSCNADMTIGATNTVVIELSNPANVAQSASSSTTAPSACGFSVTDGSVSVPALSTASLTISVAVASTVTQGTVCSASVSVNQA